MCVCACVQVTLTQPVSIVGVKAQLTAMRRDLEGVRAGGFSYCARSL